MVSVFRLPPLLLFFAVVYICGPAPAHAQIMIGYEGVSRYDSPLSRLQIFKTQPQSPSGVAGDMRLIVPDPPPQGHVRARRNLAPVTLVPPDNMDNAGKQTLAAAPPSLSDDDEKAPVDMQANELFHDNERNIVTASGDVMIAQSGRILRADRVSYNVNTDTVTAKGNVVLNEPNGDIHTAEAFELRDRMKDGFVNELHSRLNDGARFKAEKARREQGTRTIMENAAYTPCKICKTDPEGTPTWELRAKEVTHDEEQNRVFYEHAWFEFLGVPLVYTPYFSHADGTIDRKSGFLAPRGGYKSELGVFLEGRYYLDIAPDRDATFGLIAMTEEAPLFRTEYRQKWESAELLLDGGITYSARPDSQGGRAVTQDEEIRGHVAGQGRWDMNEKWRSGFDITWASDDQYMRQYDFDDEDVLTSEVYTERFSGRNYAAGRLITFQDVRVREEQEDQPEVLPEIIASFVGKPGGIPIIKGRWDASASLLGLRREGGEQDVNRIALEAGWQRRFISDYGLVALLDANTRADFYSVRDRAIATPGSGRSRDAIEVRSFSNAHGEFSYPMVRTNPQSQIRLEPVVALTLAENVDVNSDIPNEDSRDVQIDASNIFEPNRFPGLDRIEDETRVTYGLRSGIYGHDGSQIRTFIGQSYRFDEDENPFPSGSGLDDQASDIVGEFTGIHNNDVRVNYRFQLSQEDFSSQRHEVDAYADFGRMDIGSRYLFAKALEGTDIAESREQIQAFASYYWAPQWRSRIGATQDLGAAPGLREAFLGLDYFGQCLSWSLTGERNLTDEVSGESDTEIVFRIGLKNIGEFQQSDWQTSRKPTDSCS